MDPTELDSISAGEIWKEKPPSTLTRAEKIALRLKLIEVAKKLLGIPYEYGAEWTSYSMVPKSLDCSELVEGVYRVNDLYMPDGSQAQFDYTNPTESPLPGDLAFFGKGKSDKKVYHVGMVFDEHYIIEARGYQPDVAFETGKVILRPRFKWESYGNWLGYRVHPRLA